MNNRPMRPLPARLSPRAGTGTRRALRRLTRSASLRQSVAAALWPAVACSGVLLGVLLLWATRGTYVDWTGFQSIPTGGTR